MFSVGKKQRNLNNFLLSVNIFLGAYVIADLN